MISELTFAIIRFGFLIALWLFILGIIYALRSDLFGSAVRRTKGRNHEPAPEPMVAAPVGMTSAPTTPPKNPAVGAGSAGAAPGGMGGFDTPAGPLGYTRDDHDGDDAPTMMDLPNAGSAGTPRHLLITSGVARDTQISLDDEPITIGRSPDSTLVIVDEYTSTHHARLNPGPSGWSITDLDSTNGTKVDGTQIHGTVALSAFVPVTIGTTTFELRP